jgi:hypothetical protein
MALALCVVMGCEDDASQDGDVSTVSGRVEGSALSAAHAGPSLQVWEGAQVILGRLDGDGALTVVSNAAVETDAEGEFRIRTDLEGVRNLVVMATREGEDVRGVVSEEVRHGTIAYCPPLDDETTVEAAVYTRLVVRGSADSVSMADVASRITPEVAAEVHADTGALEALAAGLELEARARAAFLDETGVEPAEIASIEEARMDAQADLDRGRHLARGDETMARLAMEAFLEEQVQAFLHGGVTREDMARTQEVSTRALVQAADPLTPDATLALLRNTADQRAYAISGAVLGRWVAMNASVAQREAMVAAGAALRIAVQTAGSRLQIQTAFETYHDAVVASLIAQFPERAEALETSDAEIMGAGGLRAVLSAVIDAPLSTPELVAAYTTFFESVRASVQEAMGDAPAVQVQAATEAMLLTAMTV